MMPSLSIRYIVAQTLKYMAVSYTHLDVYKRQISNDAIVEYPIHCGPNSQIHGGCNVGQFTFINISSCLLYTSRCV